MTGSEVSVVLQKENESLRRLLMWFLRREDFKLDPQYFKRNLHAIAKDIGVDPQELGDLVIPLLQNLFDRMLERGKQTKDGAKS